MRCIVTAGPTYESLDDVRRLTNFSTGKLGSQLANLLTDHGHTVTLLLGYYAVYRGEQKVRDIQTFTTTADLSARLQKLRPAAGRSRFSCRGGQRFHFWKGLGAPAQR